MDEPIGILMPAAMLSLLALAFWLALHSALFRLACFMVYLLAWGGFVLGLPLYTAATADSAGHAAACLLLALLFGGPWLLFVWLWAKGLRRYHFTVWG